MPDQPEVQSWVADFEASWDETKLARVANRLPPEGDALRRPILIGLVGSDLRQQWQRGVRVGVESYLVLFPELGTPADAPWELIRAEYEARCSFDKPASLTELTRRFPGNAELMRRHLELADAARSSATKTPPSATGLDSRPAPLRPPSPIGNMPAKFGRYCIDRIIGKGGMGTVYLAHDEQLDRPVALKVPHIDPEDSPDVLARFYREARAAAHLHHPNICPVYDVGEIDGTPYLTMAYIEGTPLSQRIKGRAQLQQREAAEIVRKVARAMQLAHEKGIVHRDLKPANLHMNAQGEPVIMDFGVARRLGTDGERLTQNGQLVGTPDFMAPEQAKGEIDLISPRCDIYSLGVILYRLLTGRMPFEGTVTEVLCKLVLAKVPAPSSLRPDLDPRLEEICLRAMAREPSDRYATMAHFATALDDYLSDLTPRVSTAEPPAVDPDLPTQMGQTPTTTPKPRTDARIVLTQQDLAPPAFSAPRRRGAPVVLLLVLLGLLGAIGYGGWWWLNVHRPIQPTQGQPEPTTLVNVQDTFEGARRAFDRKEYDSALAALDEVLRLDPDFDAAYLLRGRTRAARGEADAAIGDYTRALRFPRQQVAATYRLRGLAFLARNEDTPALEDLSAVLQRDPDDVEARRARAGIYLRREQYDPALADLEAVQKAAPELPLAEPLSQAYQGRGRALLRKGDAKAAVTALEQALKYAPENAALLLDLGDAYRTAADSNNAIATYMKAWRMDPAAATVAQRLRESYEGLLKKYPDPKKPEPILQELGRLAKADPADPWPLYYRGQVLQARGEGGDTESAIQDFTTLMELPAYKALQKSVPTVTADLSRRLDELYPRYSDEMFLRDRKKLDDVVAEFTRRLQNPSQRQWAYSCRGRAYHMQGDYRSALEDFQAALQINPAHALALRYRGDAYAERNERPEAGKAFAEALRLNREDVRNWSQYLHWLLLQEDLTEYRKQCEQLLQQFGTSKDPAVLNPTVWLCVLVPDAVTDRERPIQLAKKALEQCDESDEVFFINTLSAALFRAGQPKEALAELTRLAELRKKRNDPRTGKPPDQRGTLSDSIFLTLIHQRLGNAAEAQQQLKSAVATIDNELKKMRVPWNRRVELEYLRREMVEGAKGKP